MASQLILDLNDKGVADLVKDWTDGGEYQLGGLTIKQVSNDGQLATFDVVDLPVAEDEGESSDTEDGAPPATKPMGKMSGKPAIIVSFGHHP